MPQWLSGETRTPSLGSCVGGGTGLRKVISRGGGGKGAGAILQDGTFNLQSYSTISSLPAMLIWMELRSSLNVNASKGSFAALACVPVARESALASSS